MKARDKLLNAAGQLFYEQGITATGIDTIITKASVAKMSLYNNFSSKSELVAAYIEERHQEWLQLFELRLKKAESSKAKVLAIFDAYQDHAESHYERGFRGCGLLNAAAEMPVDAPERKSVRLHKQEVQTLLEKHCQEYLTEHNSNFDLNSLVTHLSFLLEGSIMLAGLEASSDKVVQARQLADSLLEGAIK
ncbi:TetR family transcriptional regulator [Endozoicomonas sp. OPT23]|uniref:TetR/AcrR family transcriptional regulator n=1 Tax=Endozoicomonas sp. OPT23 TaxID=2072845 RepID=UPI00129BF1F9|nr:TetR/AcrR family transcriptional regulator [Endozoicomonas sp. OPT23]MRI33810.1 TetR family transcriptional regulator [Endozoicomonas sp. OPT23]